MFSNEEGACEAARRAGYIPEELLHRQEGVHVNESGDRLRGLTIFNVSVGKERYVEVKLRYKAMQVKKTTTAYVRDLGDECPQELWTILQFSLHHRITYWLRTCTPEEIAELVGHVDCSIMEAVHAATGLNFDTEVMAKERLRLPEIMKGGDIKRATDTRYLSFLGALMDILPRCVDMKESNGEITKAIYSDHLTAVIGEEAYDEAGHMNS